MFRTPLGQRQCGAVTAVADSDTLAVASDTSVDLALGTSASPPATPLSIGLTDVSLFTGSPDMSLFAGFPGVLLFTDFPGVLLFTDFPGVLLFTGFPDVSSSFAASIGVLSSWVPQYMLTTVGVRGYATARS